MADWMELPNYSMATFRQHCRTRRSRASNNHSESASSNADGSVRATYDEVRAYYINYVKRNHLSDNFRNNCEVTSIERLCVDAPFYDDEAEEIRIPEPLWEIRGFHEQTKEKFLIHAKYVVLATGIPQTVTRPLGIVGEQASRSFTYTTLLEMEDLIIHKKRLTPNSKPLLVIGCGLTAIDVLLLCQHYSIPVLHVFRRAIDDHELVLNQLPAHLFPEYERIRELIRQSPAASPVGDQHRVYAGDVFILFSSLPPIGLTNVILRVKSSPSPKMAPLTSVIFVPNRLSTMIFPWWLDSLVLKCRFRFCLRRPRKKRMVSILILIHTNVTIMKTFMHWVHWPEINSFVFCKVVLLHVQLVCWRNINKHPRIIRRRIRIVAIADCYFPYHLTFELLHDLPLFFFHLCCCSCPHQTTMEDDLRSFFFFLSLSLSFFRKAKSNTCSLALSLSL